MSTTVTSVLQDLGESAERTHCGYCASRRRRRPASEDDPATRGTGQDAPCHVLLASLWAHLLLSEDYKALMDAGWRRSGCFLYLPDNRRTCCPQYAIRLPVEAFRPSRSQRRVLRRWTAYATPVDSLSRLCLSGDEDEMDAEVDQAEKSAATLPEERKSSPTRLADAMNGMRRCNTSAAASHRSATEATSAPIPATGHLTPRANLDEQLEALRRIEPTLRPVPPARRAASGGAHYMTAAAFSRAHHSGEAVEVVAQRIADALRPHEALVREVLVCGGYVNVHARQEPLHVPTSSRLSPANTRCSPRRSTPTHRLRMQLVEAAFRSDAFALYCRYQRAIHGDDEHELTPHRYARFLVQHPFPRYPHATSRDGAYHLHTYLDERLVMVGVLDVLPGAISSKYLFYDPELPPRLSPGVFSTLCEVRLTRELFREPFYYMGYYIHSCGKMRYKAAFRPSQLRCGFNGQWVDWATVARPALDRDEHCDGFAEAAGDPERCENGQPVAGVAGAPSPAPAWHAVSVWWPDAGAPKPLHALPDRLRAQVLPSISRFARHVPHRVLARSVYIPPAVE
eukprot:ctg_1890.g493